MVAQALPAHPVRLTGELRAAARQFAALAQSGWRRVTHPASLPVAAWAVLVMWAAGIAGDAYTTLAMMGSGEFEEANGVAAQAMSVAGVPGYVAAASLLCVAFAVVSVGQKVGVYASAAAWALTCVGALKVCVAVSNAALWATS